MVAAIGFTVTFPLVFVARRERALVWLALGVVVLQGLAAPAGQALAGLTGLALALTATTILALAGLLHQLAAARSTFAGLLRAAAVVAAITAPSFLVADLLLPAAPAAVAGVIVTCALVVALPPASSRRARLPPGTRLIPMDGGIAPNGRGRTVRGWRHLFPRRGACALGLRQLWRVARTRERR